MIRPLACADFTFPLLEHDAALDLIAALGFQGVDLGLFEGRSHLVPSREFADVARSGGDLRRKLDDRGLRAADVFIQSSDFREYAINHPNAERRAVARDLFERALEYAAVLDAPHVTALPGVDFPEEPLVDSLQRCSEELAWRVERARDAGITFSVEAHVGSVVPEPKAAAALVERTPGLTLTLDYTHFTRQGMPDAEIEPLVQHASHFHVRGAREGRLQASFKDNTIDYARVLAVMDEVGYAGYLGVEYVWQEWEQCNEVDNISETALFRDFLRAQAKG
jgi:sugar phosphate isomerase/epimerase